MKVLMFGWEFPPFSTGGLGTACKGLTKALAQRNVEVTFVVPGIDHEYSADGTRIIPAYTRKYASPSGKRVVVGGYVTAESYHQLIAYHLKKGNTAVSLYGRDLFNEVERYARAAAELATQIDHDVIHAHDWLTYKAGLGAKALTGKPLVLHMHATEYDRCGDNPNPYVVAIEREGMLGADAVICVSNYTKNRVVERYGIPAQKVFVVHNGVEADAILPFGERHPFALANPIVLFMGRVTMQKGPDYFLKAAKRVLDLDPSLRFIIAGTGDKEVELMREAAVMGIGDKVLFTGFLKGDEIQRMYRMATVYVMPSVSEPFGIAPLESLLHETPVIISRQSGVSEVLNHCIKVDFWDIDALASKIIGVVHHAYVGKVMGREGRKEALQQRWMDAAAKVCDVYLKVMPQVVAW